MLRRQIGEIPGVGGTTMAKSVRKSYGPACFAVCSATPPTGEASVRPPNVCHTNREIDIGFFATRATNGGPWRWMRLFVCLYMGGLLGGSQVTSDSHLVRPKQIFGSLVAFFFSSSSY